MTEARPRSEQRCAICGGAAEPAQLAECADCGALVPPRARPARGEGLRRAQLRRRLRPQPQLRPLHRGDRGRRRAAASEGRSGAMTTLEQHTCTVCGASETDPGLLFDCTACGTLFHLQPALRHRGNRLRRRVGGRQRRAGAALLLQSLHRPVPGAGCRDCRAPHPPAAHSGSTRSRRSRGSALPRGSGLPPAPAPRRPRGRRSPRPPAEPSAAPRARPPPPALPAGSTPPSRPVASRRRRFSAHRPERRKQRPPAAPLSVAAPRGIRLGVVGLLVLGYWLGRFATLIPPDGVFVFDVLAAAGGALLLALWYRRRMRRYLVQRAAERERERRT